MANNPKQVDRIIESLTDKIMATMRASFNMTYEAEQTLAIALDEFEAYLNNK